MQAALQRPPPARLPTSGDEEPRGRVAWGGSASLAGSARSVSRDASRVSGGVESDKKGSKAKDLSHVPCKFFKASSCTAGKSCPFSHDLTIPGTTKPICQWYAKGNCKFGHKCALAHILPGQPMSFDRKNKRAAQAALREAQAAGGAIADLSEPSTSPPSARSPPAASGIARSLGRTSEFSHPGAEQNDWLRSQSQTNGLEDGTPQQDLVNIGRSFNGNSNTHPTAVDVFGSASSSSSAENNPLRPFPQQQSFSALSATPPAASGLSFSSPPVTISPSQPSGLSQTLAQQLGANSSPFGSSSNSGGNRSSVAAQVMLSAQSRRLSNNNTSTDSLSPPRPSSTSRAAYNADLPNAIPSSSNTRSSPAPASSLSIFGTSPFSNSANSRALFMPSSYDSNEDHFPRSPPARLPYSGLEEVRSSSVEWGRADEYALGTNGLGEDDDDDDEGEGGAYDEGFLPSSLNDLLTPEEQRRRSSKLGQQGELWGSSRGGGGSFNPFAGAKSVPAEMMMARGRPSLSSSASAGVTSAAWGTLSASAAGTNPSAQEYTPSISSSPTPASRSLLSGISAISSSPTPTSQLLLPRPTPLPSGIYSSSFDARSLLPHHQAASPSYARHLAPSASSTAPVPLTAPSSLPGGLAAGLSQLHLIPPKHTGDTPPTSSSLLTARTGNSATAQSPARVSAWGAWGSPGAAGAAGGESPRTFAAAVAAGAPRALPRTMSSHQAQQQHATASPLRSGVAGSAGSDQGEEEEIQFSMDT